VIDRRELETQEQAFKKQADEAVTNAKLQFAKERVAYQRRIQDY
jgi:hypothetical protein